MAHRGHTVLAMDCVLASAEVQHGRPLNEIVRHRNGKDARALAAGVCSGSHSNTSDRRATQDTWLWNVFHLHSASHTGSER